MSLMKDSMLSVECNSKRQHGTSVLFPLHVHRTTQGTFTFHLDDLILVRLLSVNLNIQVIHVARQETNQFLLSKFRLKGNSACLGEMKHYWISSASLFYLHHVRSCAASAHGAPKWIWMRQTWAKVTPKRAFEILAHLEDSGSEANSTETYKIKRKLTAKMIERVELHHSMWRTG